MPLLHKLNIAGEREKDAIPEGDCKWLLRAGIYIKNESGFIERIGDSGKIYCMYTCSETAETCKPRPDEGNPGFVTYEKILKSDVSCCPHMNEINNQCPIIEQARVLEAYYQSQRTKKDSI